MSKLIQIYHRFPYPLRVLAASMKGYSLRWWRYSSETEKLAQEILIRDGWSPADWQAWREKRLAYLLNRAATRVPYYREYWQNLRRQGDRRSWEYLENWPVLTKEPLRTQPEAFLADDCDPRRMYVDRTSGSTGKPLNLWMSRETVRNWYAVFEARARMWFGVNRHDRWAMIGGQMVTPYSANRPPFWVWNAGLNQLYLSNYHIAEKFLPDYLKAMADYRVSYLLGYTSAIYSMARLLVEAGLKPPPLKVVLTSAEQLYPYQREWIETAFQCPVIDTYAMVEIVTAASQCLAGNMHLWPEVGVTEILSETSDEPLPAGESGRIVGTGLINADMPLIRFQTGDRGALAPEDALCTCGRCLPMLKSIEGRLNDVIITRDGRRVGHLSPVFKGELPIREAQVVQERNGSLRLLVVPAPDYTSQTGALLVTRMLERLGDMDISLELVDAIPRSANGKFRGIISHMDLSQPASVPMEMAVQPGRNGSSVNS